jgi:Fis family transcriptional regulator, factor for inversion stimulation protein
LSSGCIRAGIHSPVPVRVAYVNSPPITRGETVASPASSALRDHVGRSVRRYLSDLGDHVDGKLHEFVLREVEAPLFAEVLRHFDGNQTRAAAALGINRATLRRRLRDLGLD